MHCKQEWRSASGNLWEAWTTSAVTTTHGCLKNFFYLPLIGRKGVLFCSRNVTVDRTMKESCAKRSDVSTGVIQAKMEGVFAYRLTLAHTARMVSQPSAPDYSALIQTKFRRRLSKRQIRRKFCWKLWAEGEKKYGSCVFAFQIFYSMWSVKTITAFLKTSFLNTFVHSSIEQGFVVVPRLSIDAPWFWLRSWIFTKNFDRNHHFLLRRRS